MLDEVCAYLNNWFPTGMYHAEFVITYGMIRFHDGSELPLQTGQYFRIIGSVFNDGVYKYDSELKLTDEVFDGTVWAMAVPPALIALIGEIEAWCAKYAATDSEAMSPYNSESFGGYSYSKSAGGSEANGSGSPSWKSAYASRLARWRRL